MAGDIFAFTLTTPEEFEKGDAIWETRGGPIGRALYKSKTRHEGYYTYHVESSKEDFERIQSGEIMLYHMDKYHVSSCNVWYTRG